MQARHTQNTQPNPLGRSVTSAVPRATALRKESKETKAKPVEFTLSMPQATVVAIAGTFNNWDLKKTPMQRDSNSWKATIPLPPGRYEYRFVVDGEWICDPNARESVENGYGSRNSVVTV